MDWFKKRKAAARMAKFFGPPNKPKADCRKIVGVPRFGANRRGKLKKIKDAVHMSVYGKHWWGEPTPHPTSAFQDGRAFAYHLCLYKGYKVLGSGHYSLVVAKDGSDKVIKIGHNPQDRWIEYCKWAAENGFAGNFAPEVYSYKYIKGANGNFTVSAVERLKDTFYKGIHREHDYFPYQALVEYKVSYGNQMAGTLADLVYPGTAAFLEQFKEKFTNQTDMHGGNIMIREGGSICFSDPIAGYGHSFTKRLKKNDFASKAVTLEVAAKAVIKIPSIGEAVCKDQIVFFNVPSIDSCGYTVCV